MTDLFGTPSSWQGAAQSIVLQGKVGLHGWQHKLSSFRDTVA